MIRPNNFHWFTSEANVGTFEWAVLVQPQRVTWEAASQISSLRSTATDG